MPYLLHSMFRLTRAGQSRWTMLVASLLAFGLVAPVPSPARIAWADEEEEARAEGEEPEDESSDDESPEEEASDDEPSQDEPDAPATDDDSAEGETDDSLLGRLERVKQLIAEGKSDEAQSLLDAAIEQAREMAPHEEHHNDEAALDVEQLKTLVSETREQMLATLQGASVVGEATNAVEATSDTLTSTLDELRPSAAIQAAIKEARAKAREIFRDARKNGDAMRVLQRNNIAGRFDELLSNAAHWRDVEETLDEMKNQVTERLREGEWQNELDEAMTQAIGRVRDSFPEELFADNTAEQWNDERFQQANQIGDVLEIARRTEEQLASIFERDFIAEAIEVVNRTREGAEATLNENDLGAAWEEALSQAAAEQPEIEAFRNNEHAARLRTVLADFKTNVLQALSVDAKESLMRANLSDAVTSIRKSFEPANIESKWQEITSSYEMRMEQLRADAEQKRVAAEEAARQAEEQAEAAEAARQLAEEQAAEASEQDDSQEEEEQEGEREDN